MDLGNLGHVMTIYMTSIIRNRIFNNKSTYAAFIDMEKRHLIN